MVEYTNLASPPLALDVFEQTVLVKLGCETVRGSVPRLDARISPTGPQTSDLLEACRTTMGGDVHLLSLATGGGYALPQHELQLLQSFKDHQKQVRNHTDGVLDDFAA